MIQKSSEFQSPRVNFWFANSLVAAVIGMTASIGILKANSCAIMLSMEVLAATYVITFACLARASRQKRLDEVSYLQYLGAMDRGLLSSGRASPELDSKTRDLVNMAFYAKAAEAGQGVKPFSSVSVFAGGLWFAGSAVVVALGMVGSGLLITHSRAGEIVFLVYVLTVLVALLCGLQGARQQKVARRAVYTQYLGTVPPEQLIRSRLSSELDGESCDLITQVLNEKHPVWSFKSGAHRSL